MILVLCSLTNCEFLVNWYPVLKKYFSDEVWELHYSMRDRSLYNNLIVYPFSRIIMFGFLLGTVNSSTMGFGA